MAIENAIEVSDSVLVVIFCLGRATVRGDPKFVPA